MNYRPWKSPFSVDRDPFYHSGRERLPIRVHLWDPWFPKMDVAISMGGLNSPSFHGKIGKYLGNCFRNDSLNNPTI